MRVWLDPARLKARGLTTNDVVRAIRDQNLQVAAGQIGAPPTPSGQSFQYTVNASGRLSEVAEFENLILRVEDGAILRLRDVARVELGAQNYAMFMRLNGQPSVAVGIYQLPGANALEVAAGVAAAMGELAQRFPDGLAYRIAYDLPWNPNRLEQRFGRIHRIGQTEVCHLWNLVADETREGDVYRRLLEKLEQARQAPGGQVFRRAREAGVRRATAARAVAQSHPLRRTAGGARGSIPPSTRRSTARTFAGPARGAATRPRRDGRQPRATGPRGVWSGPKRAACSRTTSSRSSARRSGSSAARRAATRSCTFRP